jgi:diguanylate cyclase (GGDEF)-like protein/PAS domain S-box-containing protein
MKKYHCLYRSIFTVLSFLISVIFVVSAAFSNEYKYLSLGSALLLQLILFCLMIRYILKRHTIAPKADLVYQAVENMKDGLLITDSQNTIIYSNASVSHITEFSISELEGNTPNLFSSGKQSKHFYEEMYKTLTKVGMWTGVLWNRKKSGELYAESISISSATINAQRRYIATFRDVTSEALNIERITEYAYKDLVTQLPNRRHIMDEIKHTVSLADRGKFPFYVLYIDLDDFKQVNDTFGHDTGDEYLFIVGQRLSKRFREADTVARFGGDEFVILLPFINDLSPERVKLMIDESLGPVAIIDNKEIPIKYSHGLSKYPTDASSADSLLEIADARMYELKREHKKS